MIFLCYAFISTIDLCFTNTCFLSCSSYVLNSVAVQKRFHPSSNGLNALVTELQMQQKQLTGSKKKPQLDLKASRLQGPM